MAGKRSSDSFDFERMAKKAKLDLSESLGVSREY